MPAHTPTGWRIDQLSIPVPTFSVKSPRSRCGIPQANSTISSPRITSPRASDSTLPCSSVISLASSSTCASISALNRNSTRARDSGGVADQAGSARRAAATAAPVSAASASASCARIWPVAGSYTGDCRPEPPAIALPSMKCPIERGWVSVRVFAAWAALRTVVLMSCSFRTPRRGRRLHTIRPSGRKYASRSVRRRVSGRPRSRFAS